MRITHACLLVFAAACADGGPVIVEDQPAPHAVAFVGGRVLDAAGAPVAGQVTIRCALAGINQLAPIDAQGHYGASLQTSPESIGGRSGRLACEFTATGGARAEASIGFGPPGLPHPLQIVDLHTQS